MSRQAMDPALFEPPIEQKRFSLPKRLGGLPALRDLVEGYGGPELVCRDLRIAPDLLAVYLSGRVEAPFTLYLALHWSGPTGFNQAYSETHWTHQAMVARVKLAEARLAQHQLLLQAIAPHFKGMIVLAKTYGIEDAWLIEAAARLRADPIEECPEVPVKRSRKRRLPRP